MEKRFRKNKTYFKWINKHKLLINIIKMNITPKNISVIYNYK